MLKRVLEEHDKEIQANEPGLKYSMIQKDGLNFVHLYFLNYTWYVNDLHNI